MRRTERDLGTRLEWVAVDHWDTDNPHSHVVVRGKDEKGENLVIGREYISHGMRTRASEIATEWLGPRTNLEIRQSLVSDVEQGELRDDAETVLRRLGERRDIIRTMQRAFGSEHRELTIGGERRGQQTFASPNFLTTLRDREIATVVQKIARETGLRHRPLVEGAQVSGTYRRSIMLV